MISPYQIYDNECGRYTFRFQKIYDVLYVDISFYNKKINGTRSWIHSTKDNKIIPRNDKSFIPLGQDVQDYINSFVKLKAFL